MNQIPTADEYRRKYMAYPYDGDTIKEALIEFAQLHVDAALKAAAENATIYRSETDERYDSVNTDSILTAYKDQIK